MGGFIARFRAKSSSLVNILSCKYFGNSMTGAACSKLTSNFDRVKREQIERREHDTKLHFTLHVMRAFFVGAINFCCTSIVIILYEATVRGRYSNIHQHRPLYIYLMCPCVFPLFIWWVIQTRPQKVRSCISSKLSMWAHISRKVWETAHFPLLQ